MYLYTYYVLLKTIECILIIKPGYILKTNNFFIHLIKFVFLFSTIDYQPVQQDECAVQPVNSTTSLIITATTNNVTYCQTATATQSVHGKFKTRYLFYHY